MKKTMIALTMLFAAVFTVQAQEDQAEKQALAIELMGIDLKMNVDTDLFEKISTNMYISRSPQAMVMGMIIPETYETAKKEIQKNLPADIQVSEKGEKVINGVKVLFLKGTSKTPKGTVNCIVYVMKRDAATSTMFMGISEPGIAQKYLDAIEKAANSVIKKE